MFYLALTLVFALIVAVFAVQNDVAVSVRFLAWGFETSLVIVILGSAVLGALMVGLPGLFRQLALRLKLREVQSRLRRSQDELAHSRAEVVRQAAEFQAQKPGAGGRGAKDGASKEAPSKEAGHEEKA